MPVHYDLHAVAVRDEPERPLRAVQPGGQLHPVGSGDSWAHRVNAAARVARGGDLLPLVGPRPVHSPAGSVTRERPARPGSRRCLARPPRVLMRLAETMGDSRLATRGSRRRSGGRAAAARTRTRRRPRDQSPFQDASASNSCAAGGSHPYVLRSIVRPSHTTPKSRPCSARPPKALDVHLQRLDRSQPQFRGALLTAHEAGASQAELSARARRLPSARRECSPVPATRAPPAPRT